jgi:hypothetical protein
MNEEELADLVSNHFPNLYIETGLINRQHVSIKIIIQKLWNSLYLNLEVKIEPSFHKTLRALT